MLTGTAAKYPVALTRYPNTKQHTTVQDSHMHLQATCMICCYCLSILRRFKAQGMAAYCNNPSALVKASLIKEQATGYSRYSIYYDNYIQLFYLQMTV